jgi:hypothetical protein
MFLKKGYEWAFLRVDREKKKIRVCPLTHPDRRAYSISYHKNAREAWVFSKGLLKAIGWKGWRYRLNAYWNPRRLLVEFDIPDCEKSSKANVVVMEVRRAG